MAINQHKITFWGVITTMVSVIGAIITGVIAIGGNWSEISEMMRKTDIIYEHADELEHMINDSHEVLQYRAEHTRDYVEMRHRIDSLENIIELMERGKHPYDSIWVQYPNGTWHLTTIEDLLNQN